MGLLSFLFAPLWATLHSGRLDKIQIFWDTLHSQERGTGTVSSGLDEEMKAEKGQWLAQGHMASPQPSFGRWVLPWTPFLTLPLKDKLEKRGSRKGSVVPQCLRKS